MNPLDQKTIKLLDQLGLIDLRRKVMELVKVVNDHDKSLECLEDCKHPIRGVGKETDTCLECGEKLGEDEFKCDSCSDEVPMGVSKWLAHGKKYGYINYLKINQ